jgi:haloalkane dehalogenase
VLEDNFFIEKFMPMTVLRDLDEVTMNHYRHSFEKAGEDRRPMITFPREVPFNGQPEDTTSMVAAYSAWMAENELPKLLVKAEPGLAITGEILAHCSQWKNQQQITVPGVHYLQEDSPDEIGAGIASWYKGLS